MTPSCVMRRRRGWIYYESNHFCAALDNVRKPVQGSPSLSHPRATWCDPALPCVRGGMRSTHSSERTVVTPEVAENDNTLDEVPQNSYIFQCKEEPNDAFRHTATFEFDGRVADKNCDIHAPEQAAKDGSDATTAMPVQHTHADNQMHCLTATVSTMVNDNGNLVTPSSMRPTARNLQLLNARADSETLPDLQVARSSSKLCKQKQKHHSTSLPRNVNCTFSEYLAWFMAKFSAKLANYS